MKCSAQIAILDDDHVTRMVRYALADPGDSADAFMRDFFAPEIVNPSRVYATSHSLRASDGVAVIPPAGGDGCRGGRDATILIYRRGIIDGALLAANPKLKLVQRIGERTDGIDIAAAASRGVAVSCLPRRTLRYAAEHAILMMLGLTKQLVAADAAVRADRWDRGRVKPTDGVAYNWAGLQGLSGLFGRTLGIVGLGEVGALVARIAGGFGMRVVYANRHRLPRSEEDRLGVQYVALSELLAAADFVSLYALNLPQNRNLMDATAFATMKPTAFFINTSRGRMVDEGALHAALVNGLIAGAGLDVHAQEPRPQPDRFAALRNVILTPHCAGGSRQGLIEELEEIFGNCRAALAGAPVNHRVLPQA
jgi:phosphoglycerate dehydrogenase-like enzyme